MLINFKINGADKAIEVSANERLLDIIREELHMTGTKEGCGVGECGACTVLLNDEAVSSCLVPAMHADNSIIMTIEGVERTMLGAAIQESFIECGAVQCGFCTPGMVISAYALLSKNPNPTEAQVKKALSGNLCRCTGYVKIIEAVMTAVTKL